VKVETGPPSLTNSGAVAVTIRVAVPSAKCGLPEVKLGLLPGAGGTQRLPRIVGDGVARDLILTARDIDAGHGLRVGLVTEVLPDAAALLARARELAGLISAHSPLAVQGAKHVLNAAARAATREGLDYVALWNSAFLHSDDLEEAVRSFAERRKPRFTGR